MTMPKKKIMITEKELRKCGVCDGILDHCHSKGKKSFCRKLLSDLRDGHISDREFMKKLEKKIDIDKMLDEMEKNEG